MGNKRLKAMIIVLSIALITGCIGIGIIYAEGLNNQSDSTLTQNNAPIPGSIITPDKSTLPDPSIVPGKVIIPDTPIQISDDLRQKLFASLPHSNRVNITITDEEKIELGKEGYSFEEIDAAVMLANDKQETDVVGLLKNHMDEVKTFKDKLEKAPVKDKNDMVNEQTMKDYISKGYTRSDVNFAYFASKQLGVTLDDALQSVKSGDSDFANKLKAKVGEVKNNEK